MFSRLLIVTVLLLATGVLGSRAALAQDDEDILGTWESYNKGKGEFSFVTFNAGGSLTVEVFDAEPGTYVVDEEQHKFGWINPNSSEEDEPDWVDYKLDGDRLVVTEGDMEIPLERIWQPKEPANVLAGRWQMLIDEIEGIDELREAGEEIPGAFIIDMGNNGSALTMELDETLVGSYSLDAEAGTFEITIGDEVEAGSYRLDGNRLVLIVDDEELVYERTQ
jgi:hypothetical protein